MFYYWMCYGFLYKETNKLLNGFCSIKFAMGFVLSKVTLNLQLAGFV